MSGAELADRWDLDEGSALTRERVLPPAVLFGLSVDASSTPLSAVRSLDINVPSFFRRSRDFVAVGAGLPSSLSEFLEDAAYKNLLLRLIGYRWQNTKSSQRIVNEFRELLEMAAADGDVKPNAGSLSSALKFLDAVCGVSVPTIDLAPSGCFYLQWTDSRQSVAGVTAKADRTFVWSVVKKSASDSRKLLTASGKDELEATIETLRVQAPWVFNAHEW